MAFLANYAFRSLKKNKKRTAVTIVGVILATALMMGTFLLGDSAQDFLIRMEILNTGDYHACFTGVTMEQANQLATDDSVSSQSLSQALAYSPIENPANTAKPYIFVQAYDKKALDAFNVELLNGRMPVRDDEILVPEHYLEAEQRLTLGTVINIRRGIRRGPDGTSFNQKTAYHNETWVEEGQATLYKVVGTIKRLPSEPFTAPGYTFITYLDAQALAPDATIDSYLKLHKPKDVYEVMPQLAGTINADFQTNDSVLRMMGISDNASINKMLFGVIAVLLTIIVIASISLIYNSFSIAVAERQKQFGHMRSIGATPRQIRQMVYWEATMIGLVSFPIGVLSGIVGIKIVLLIINRYLAELSVFDMGMSFVIAPDKIALTLIFLILTLFLSTYLPARRSGRATIIAGIRQQENIVVPRRSWVVGSWLMKKIFGFEAELAQKNLKRSRKKYNSTIISLAISVLLFVVTSSFITSVFDSTDNIYQEADFDIVIVGNTIDGVNQLTPQIVKRLKADIEDQDIILSDLRFGMAKMQVPMEQFNEDMLDIFKSNFTFNSNQIAMTASIYEMNDRDFLKLCSANDLDVTKLTDPTHPQGIYVAESRIRYGKIYYKPLMNYQVSESFGLITDEDRPGELAVGAVISEAPFAVQPSSLRPTIIVSETVGEHLRTQGIYLYSEYEVYIATEDPDAMALWLEDQNLGEGLHILNIGESNRQMASVRLIASLLCYGFIALITLIGISNLYNAISTNIMLRQREFAIFRSVGMDPHSFHKMLNIESALYGFGALLVAIPLSLIASWFLLKSFGNIFVSNQLLFNALPWAAVVQASLGIIVLIFVMMRYSVAQVKDDNIAETLRLENI